MKTKLLTLFSLLALLLVSTAILADGRPTGIRIGRAVSGGNMNVEIDVSITNTYTFYFGDGSNTVWIGNSLGGGPTYAWARQYTGTFSPGPGAADPLPWAIDWGDGYYLGNAVLFGPGSGPWTGTFSHTYLTPGTYLITAGDAIGCCRQYSSLGTNGTSRIYTGNVITGHTRYVWNREFASFYNQTFKTTNYFLAVTNTATVNTGTGIPTLNIYGLLAMAFVLVGTGVLLFRRPTVA